VDGMQMYIHLVGNYEENKKRKKKETDVMIYLVSSSYVLYFCNGEA
jgi:hypothetical protein